MRIRVNDFFAFCVVLIAWHFSGSVLACSGTDQHLDSPAEAIEGISRAIDSPEADQQTELAEKIWRNGRFIYELSPEVALDPAKTSTFENACKSLLDTTALECTPRSSVPEEADYVYVLNGVHDFSFVGRQGGCQELSILTWSNPIIVAHEIKHALGWAHEQQHPERDQFIEIRLDDIPAQFHAEFITRDYGNEGPYDPDSIMHFYPSDFAKPGRDSYQPKRLLTEADVLPGQRDHFSQTDLAEIRDFYGVRPSKIPDRQLFENFQIVGKRGMAY